VLLLLGLVGEEEALLQRVGRHGLEPLVQLTLDGRRKLAEERLRG
jgi:hypothetical protein